MTDKGVRRVSGGEAGEAGRNEEESGVSILVWLRRKVHEGGREVSREAGR